MKVRCIKDFAYQDVYGKSVFVEKNSIKELYIDECKRVVDEIGSFIVHLGGSKFNEYFEIIKEEPEHDINYSFIKEMLINVADLIDKKNKDYGNSYHTTREKYGHTAFLIRLSDKISRYEQLIQNDRLVEDESLIDTLEDIIGYTALEIEYLSGGKE